MQEGWKGNVNGRSEKRMKGGGKVRMRSHEERKGEERRGKGVTLFAMADNSVREKRKVHTNCIASLVPGNHC